MTGVDQDETGVTVTLRPGEHGPEERRRCRYLVAADGAKSAIRPMLGLDFEPERLPDCMNRQDRELSLIQSGVAAGLCHRSPKSALRKQSRYIFEQRARVLAALEKGRAQIEAGVVPELEGEDRLKAELQTVIADAIHRGELYEQIARRVRAYFNRLNTEPAEVGSARCADRGRRSAASLPGEN